MVTFLLAACGLWSSPPSPTFQAYQLGHPAAYPVVVVEGSLHAGATGLDLSVKGDRGGDRHWVHTRVELDEPQPVPGKLALTWYSVIDDQFFALDAPLPVDPLGAELDRATALRTTGTPGDARAVGIDVYPGGRVQLVVSDSYIVLPVTELQGELVQREVGEALGVSGPQRAYRGQTLKATRQAYLPADRAKALWDVRRTRFDYRIEVTAEALTEVATIGVRGWDRSRTEWSPTDPGRPRRLPIEAWAKGASGRVRVVFDEEELFTAAAKAEQPFTLSIGAEGASLVSSTGTVVLSKAEITAR